MATNFPTSLDSLTNPTASDKLNSVTVPHASQHATLNDAVEALEAKVGVDGSAVTTSHDYLIAKQSVVPYDDASARTTAVPSPVEGQMSYLKDTNTVEVYDGSAWVSVGGATMIKKVEAFTASGTWTVPTGVTYAIAHMLGGGGGGGAQTIGTAGAGGNSSVGFASGTVTALGGVAGIATQSAGNSTTYAQAANSGVGGTSNATNTANCLGGDAQWTVAGAAVTPAASITVTVGAGGTGGTGGAVGGDGGTGYVWIEYYEPA